MSYASIQEVYGTKFGNNPNNNNIYLKTEENKNSIQNNNTDLFQDSDNDSLSDYSVLSSDFDNISDLEIQL